MDGPRAPGRRIDSTEQPKAPSAPDIGDPEVTRPAPASGGDPKRRPQIGLEIGGREDRSALPGTRHRLGAPERIAGPGGPVGAMASINEAGGEVVVIVYHHDEFEWDTREDDPQGPPAQVEVRLENVPFGSAVLQHFRIDAEHSSSFDEWKRLGRPEADAVDAAAARRLAEAARLAPMEPDRLVDLPGGRLALHTALPLNSLSLYVLRAR